MSSSHAQNFFFFPKLKVLSFQSTLAPVGANSEKIFAVRSDVISWRHPAT